MRRFIRCFQELIPKGYINPEQIVRIYEENDDFFAETITRERFKIHENDYRDLIH